MSKTSRVAIVKCSSYEETEVNASLRKLLSCFKLKDIIEDGDKVLLKPNLCLPAEIDDNLTTHPQIIRQLSIILAEKKCEISIGDTSIGFTNKERSKLVWEMSGMDALIEELGIGKNTMDKGIIFKEVTIDGKSFILPISESVFQNKVINVPKFKSHGYMLLTGCVKNTYGVLAGDAKKRFHKLAEDKDTFAKLIVKLHQMIDCKLHIVDAVMGIEGEGPGKKGLSRKVGLIIAGTNGFAVDRVLARLMNVREEDVLTNYYGLMEEEIEIVGEPLEDLTIKDFLLPEITHRSDRVIEHVIEAKSSMAKCDDEKCSRCGICISNCPASAMTGSEEGIKIDVKYCIGCLVCSEVCPRGAIQVVNGGLLAALHR